MKVVGPTLKEDCRLSSLKLPTLCLHVKKEINLLSDKGFPWANLQSSPCRQVKPVW